MSFFVLSAFNKCCGSASSPLLNIIKLHTVTNAFLRYASVMHPLSLPRLFNSLNLYCNGLPLPHPLFLSLSLTLPWTLKCVATLKNLTKNNLACLAAAQLRQRETSGPDKLYPVRKAVFDPEHSRPDRQRDGARLLPKTSEIRMTSPAEEAQPLVSLV